MPSALTDGEERDFRLANDDAATGQSCRVAIDREFVGREAREIANVDAWSAMVEGTSRDRSGLT
jgi:hypothetical protein